MTLNESDAAAMLGINVKNDSRSQEMVTFSGPRNDRPRRGLRTEADMLLYGDDDQGGMVDEDAKSGVDSLCGKVMAWFFMWDTQY